MNVIARTTLLALAGHGVTGLPHYRRALESACSAFPPVFGKKAYGDLYRKRAVDRGWIAISLVTNAIGEGKGARHLWDMAASTKDPDVASQLQEHALDEARHARAYLTLFDLVFPDLADEPLRARLQRTPPTFTKTTPLVARAGSPYAYSVTADELVQMNIAEIRTRVHQRLQRPFVLGYCKPDQRRRVKKIVDSLLVDETRHVAYTARLIERAAQESGVDYVVDLMRQRVQDFNAMTENEAAKALVPS